MLHFAISVSTVSVHKSVVDDMTPVWTVVDWIPCEINKLKYVINIMNFAEFT